MQATLKTRLMAISAILATGLALVAGVGIYSSSRLSTDLRSVINDSLPIIRDLTLIDMIHDGVRGYVLETQLAYNTKDKDRILSASKGIEQHASNAVAKFEEIRKHPISPTLLATLSQSEKEMSSYLTMARDFSSTALREYDHPQSAVLSKKWSDFQERFETLEGSLAELGKSATTESENFFEAKLAFGDQMLRLSSIMGGLFLVLGLGFSWAVSKGLVTSLDSVTNDVDSSATSVGTAVNQVDSASKDVLKAIQQQAAAIQQTSTALEQISSTVSSVSEQSHQVEVSSETAKGHAHKGQQIVLQMIDSIAKLRESNSTSANNLHASNGKVAEILKIIEEVASKTKIINDIVFQTRLLSFNASVEAARAGEHGKGFAVVAEEVGNLAQISGQSAVEINVLLESSLKKVTDTIQDNKRRVDELVTASSSLLNEGTQIAERCGSALTDILQSTSQVSELTKEIARGNEEAARGVSEISQAIHAINSSSQLTSGAAELCNQSTQTLSGEVTNLNEIAARLNLTVRGRLESAPNKAA